MNTQKVSSEESQQKAHVRELHDQNADHTNEPQLLDAGQWLRLMTGFEAPFGFDRMPTVWD
jgi:hypothetical protein